jgi:hypothetical protein
MSYDLAVFDPAAAPKDEEEFLEWYETERDEGGDDPAVAAPALRAWFLDMIKRFPAMDGPMGVADEEIDDAASDYYIGASFIEVSFAISQADAANEAVMELAEKHGLGIFTVGGEEEIVMYPRPADASK